MRDGDDTEQAGGVLVWFEGTAGGRSALAQAHAIAELVMLPPDHGGRLVPPNRRNVSAKVVQALGLTHSHSASPSPSVATAQRVT